MRMTSPRRWRRHHPNDVLALYQRCALFAVILAKSLDDGAILALRRWPEGPGTQARQNS
jgi:hypothetical protein